MWPFTDSSISHIYSEHVFEHFEFCEEVPHFLSEARRSYSPAGGLFDVGVPDTEWPLHAYGRSRQPILALLENGPTRSGAKQNWTTSTIIFARGTEHKYAWDYETLARTLQRFGFTDITRREFDPAIDSESRRTGTLYVTTIKP